MSVKKVICVFNFIDISQVNLHFIFLSLEEDMNIELKF